MELGEVEAILSRHAGVQAAVAMVQEDEAGHGQLVAYVVTAEGWEPQLGDLRAFMKSRVPEYMVPSVFVELKSLPLTPNGKVNRRALADMEGGRLTGDRPFVEPRDPVEREIAAMWSGLLGHDRIGVHDDFFELGGHSLMATQLVSRIREQFSVEIPLQKFFDAPTVERLGFVVTRALAEQEDEQVLEELLDDLGDLSDEEVQKLLSRETPKAP